MASSSLKLLLESVTSQLPRVSHQSELYYNVTTTTTTPFTSTDNVFAVGDDDTTTASSISAMGNSGVENTADSSSSSSVSKLSWLSPTQFVSGESTSMDVSITSGNSKASMSSLTKMISQWRSSDSSEVSFGEDGDLGADVATQVAKSSTSSSAYITSTSISDTYLLKRNRLTILPQWVNDSMVDTNNSNIGSLSSVVRDNRLSDLPQALPLIGSDGADDASPIRGFEQFLSTNSNNINDTLGLGIMDLDGLNGSWGNMTDNLNGTGITGDELGHNYWALLLIVFSVFAVFGNVLVILSVKRERSLWNVTNYFIVSLAVADLLVAAVVMPFGVYFLFNKTIWELPPIACDFYIAMDVTCSTSSILNLVAISIDRFIAVTQPIKYAKHKSNTRVWLTIVFVWVFSGLVGSPIVLGLNTPPEPVDGTSCTFHNYYFVFFSSLCSFYIPCTILVYLYYRIFKVIRERAKKASGAGSHGKSSGATVIENLAQTKRLAETTLGGPSSLAIPKSQTMDDEKCTNTGSGSQEEGDDMDKDLDDGDDEHDGDGDGDASPDSAEEECQIISNNRVATAFVLESVRIDESRGTLGRMEQNGNHDSGYAASNVEEGSHPVPHEPSPPSPKVSLPPLEQCKRNGLKEEGEKSPAPVESATSSKKAAASRFTICKAHKASRRKKEKSSAKRERKATKTLAIVLGLFLLCWLPFFTCNIMDAICSMTKQECGPGLITFLLTTWLGYVNSCLNPIIYTIFNPEFRKAFKKIMGLGT